MPGQRDTWGDDVRQFLRRYERARRGRGGYPSTMEQEAIRRVLDQRDALLEALKVIGQRARSDGSRTFDDCIRDLGWIDDHCRQAVARAEGR